MASSTFINLKPTKQAKIRQALIHEFSWHSLATAQVARIIKNAGIARGSFYKYFADLLDAYIWTLGQVMGKLELHPRAIRDSDNSASVYCQEIKDTLIRIQQSPYLPFIRMFYEENEGILEAHRPSSSNHQQLSSQSWAIMVLCHEAIKECLLQPDQQQQILQYLHDTLKRIIGE